MTTSETRFNNSERSLYDSLRKSLKNKRVKTLVRQTPVYKQYLKWTRNKKDSAVAALLFFW